MKLNNFIYNPPFILTYILINLCNYSNSNTVYLDLFICVVIKLY
jgi:hypothetical protein